MRFLSLLFLSHFAGDNPFLPHIKSKTLIIYISSRKTPITTISKNSPSAVIENPASDVIELIRKYRAAQDTTGEEGAYDNWISHQRYKNNNKGYNYELFKKGIIYWRMYNK